MRFETQAVELSERLRRPARRRWRLVVLAVMATILAACGAPQPPGPDYPTLDCQAASYPCRFSDVELSVISRSLTLAEQIADLLASGGSTDEALELLDALPDLAEAGANEAAVVFRLEGGRPTVVDLSIDQPLAASSSFVAPAEAAQARSQAAGTLSPAVVAGGTGSPRSALVLAAFPYDFGGMDSAADVAAMLATTPDYQGRVEYLASPSDADPQVFASDLLGLDAYDVVYITTHGGTLCTDKKAGPEPLGTGTGGGGSGDCRTDFLVSRFDGDAEDLLALDLVGVVLYQGSKHRSIAVTADFFRYYYPQGLSDTLFVLVSCSTYAPDFVSAIAGSSSIFVSWDGLVDANWAQRTADLMQLMLEQGLSVGQAMEALGVATDPVNGGSLRASWRAAGGDLRIRDLVTARDAFSGDDIRTAVEIQVEDTPDDGNPDTIVLDVDVLGFFADQGGDVQLTVSVDGSRRVSDSLANLGSINGLATWHLTVDVPLGRDVKEGDEIEIRAWVTLPEGGSSVVTGTPRIAGEPEMSGTYSGTIEYYSQSLTGGINRNVVANVVLQRDPGTLPGAQYVFYNLVGGSAAFTIDGLDSQGCTVAGQGSQSLEGSNTYLRFDLTGSQPLVTGWGVTGTDPLNGIVTCPNGTSYPLSLSTNEVYFNVPESYGMRPIGGTLFGNWTEETATRRLGWAWNLSADE